jgi:hypothetical protein
MLSEAYRKEMLTTETILEFPWSDSGFYAAWLAQSCYYSSQATRILTLAAAHCPMSEQQLHRRFANHAREEQGHEILADRDVKDLGFTIEGIGEFSITEAFYKTQLYNIQTQGVRPFLGWVLYLEGLAVEFGKKIRERVAEGKHPTRFLDIHVEEDPDHVEKALQFASTCNDEDLELLIRNMRFTREMYFKILRDCEHYAAVTGSHQRRGA